MISSCVTGPVFLNKSGASGLSQEQAKNHTTVNILAQIFIYRYNLMPNPSSPCDAFA